MNTTKPRQTDIDMHRDTPRSHDAHGLVSEGD